MKCEIIRDLLPSYIDGLTSDESNRAVEEHLYGCEECQELLDQMKQDIRDPQQIEVNKKKIKPFKKVKKMVWKAVLATVIACTLIMGGMGYYYGHTWAPESGDVKMTMSTVGKIVELKFTSNDKNIALNVEQDTKNPDVISIKAGRISPFNKTLRKNGYQSYTFIDSETVITPTGEEKKLTGKDVLKIQYADKTEEIKLKDLAEQAAKDKLADSKNVEMTYQKAQNGNVTLEFQPKLLGVMLTAVKDESSQNTLLIKEEYKDSVKETEDGRAYYGFIFIDDHTLLKDDGSETKLTGEEVLTIKYADKTEEIRIIDLVS